MSEAAILLNLRFQIRLIMVQRNLTDSGSRR
jgi:hypothetical protein